TPPYSLSWTDYATSTEKFKVYLLLKDLEKPSVEVTVRIRLKGLGVVLENIPDFISTKPIVLQPGIPQILSGAQLSDNFSADNLVAQGISIEDLYQGTNLPAGFYQWEVTAYLPDQRQVSNTGVTLMTVFRAQPPTITYPANNAILPNTGFQSINFTWVSNSYYSVNTAQGTLYRLRLYEIPEEDEDTDPNVVVNAGILPVFMTEVLATNYLYSSSDPVLTPGKRYALQVQAMDVNGYDQFENNGFSQVVAFTYGTQGQLATQRCLRPQQVSLEPVGDVGVVVSWTNPNAEVLDYTLSYRKTTDDQWIEKQTSELSYTLLQLPASSYEFKVLARCSYVNKSSYSEPQGYIIAPEPIDSTIQISPPSNTIDDDTDYTSETYTVSDSNPSQQYPPAVYQAETLSSTTIDILNKPIRIVYETSSLPDSLKKNLPSSGTLPQLSSTATVEELKTALNTSKIDCASYLAGYTCGQHDAPSVPSGDIIQVKTGDEIAINSIAFEVVDLDGSGNGKGIVKVPMFNNAKLGVEFKNIKVAKGGCVVAGQAELSHIDVALLSEEQRKKLAEIYAAYNLALTVADSLAPEISETINNIGEFIQKLKNDVSNYVGGIQDAQKMKANFKFAEKYAETLLKDPTLPDSTRQKLSNAYQTALETKDFFCNGTDCNTTSKDGKGPNLIEELITPLCEQNKAKLLALNEALEGALDVVIEKDNNQIEIDKTTDNLTLSICEEKIEKDKIYIRTNDKCKLSALLITKPEVTNVDIAVEIKGSNKESIKKTFNIKTNESQDLQLESMFEGKYTISYKKDSKTITKSFYFRNKKYDFACTICGRDLTITDENFSIFFPNSKIYRENPEVLEYFNDALKKAQFNTCYRHAHFFSQCFVESAGFNASAEGSKYGIDNLLETFNRNANTDGPKDHWYKQTFWDDKDYLNYVLMRVYETVAIGEQGTKIPKSNGYRTFKFFKSITDTVRVVVAYDNMPKKGTYKSVSFTKDKQKINKQNVMNVAYANKLGNGDSKSGDGYRYRGRGAIQITGKSVYYGVGSKCNELFGTNYDFTSNPDIG
ncbi:fibronectin type III domain-containing protein, partial [Flectobacillus sp. DC10W]